jgi:hypothetical protein
VIQLFFLTSSIDMLPGELVQILNDAYFLHVLATDPAKVIPPGKSLLSMMVRSQHREQSTAPDAITILHDKVEEAVHKAFWNEVPWHHSPI